MSKKPKRQTEPPVSCDLIYEVRGDITGDIIILGEILGLLNDITQGFSENDPKVSAHFADCAGIAIHRLRERMDEHASNCYRFRAWLKEAEQKKVAI